MQKILLVLFLPALCVKAAVTFSGTSIKNGTNLSDGDFAAYLVSKDGTSLDSSSFSFNPGDDLTVGATYGSSFQLIGSNSAADVFGDTLLGSGFGFDLTSGVDLGDSFGILSFDTSTSTAIGGDTFRVWTAGNWDVPSDGDTESFGSQLTQLDSVGASSVGTVVPEPSYLAFFIGCFGMACAISRRRI